MNDILDFDEMYRIECIETYGQGFDQVYQVNCDINPDILMKQIKAEREYLINELVDISFCFIDSSKKVNLDDIEELKMTIRYEILEELQIKYDEYISKSRENK